MSVYKIFGVVADAGPILESTISTIITTIDTLRRAKAIKEQMAKDITILCYELKMWYQVSVRIIDKMPSHGGRESQTADDFVSLFEDFPVTIDEITWNSRRIAERSSLSLLIYRFKLEGMVVELEKQLQCIFRRISLLVVSLRDVSSTSKHITTDDVLPHGERADRIRGLLMARLDSQFFRTNIYCRNSLIQSQPVLGAPQLFIATLEQSDIRAVVERRVFKHAHLDPRALERTEDTIRRLMGMPSQNWPILGCYGACQVTGAGLFDTVIDVLYALPASAVDAGQPRTLRYALTCEPTQPLSTRLRLAKEVANAILFVHISGMVHKNIQPGTILLLSPRVSEEPSLGNAFLVGFTSSRCDNPHPNRNTETRARHEIVYKPVGGVDSRRTDPSLQPMLTSSKYNDPHTGKLGPPVSFGGLSGTTLRTDVSIQHTIDRGELIEIFYEHPNRESGSKKYSMLHDIYALGVVLLEIGLWQSLIDEVDGVRLGPLAINAFGDAPTPDSKLEAKVALVECAQRVLPFAMGDLYTWVVLSCLTCMDTRVSNSGLGARFVEIVLDKLDKIQM